MRLHGFALLAAILVVGNLGCISSGNAVWCEWLGQPPRGIHAVAIQALNLDPRVERSDTESLIAAFRAQCPDVAIVQPEEAEWLLTFLKDDLLLCTDCGEANGSHRQYWSWYVEVSRYVVNPTHGVRERKIVGTLSGETHKWSSSPSKQFAAAFRRVLAGEELPTSAPRSF